MVIVDERARMPWISFVDARARNQVEDYWPDIVDPFAELVPDGCSIWTVEDEWSPGARHRSLSVVAQAGAPAREELLEEAAMDAGRVGWALLSDPGQPLLFELENVRLRLVGTPGEPEAICFSLEQPWPDTPPVQTTERFQNLVRKLLGLPGEPIKLHKKITLSLYRDRQFNQLRERVELTHDGSKLADFSHLGFRPVSAATSPKSRAKEMDAEFKTVAELTLEKDTVIVDSIRTRLHPHT